MIKTLTSAVYTFGGLFLLFGLRFSWCDLGGMSVDTVCIVAIMLISVGSILNFMSVRR